MSFSVTIRDFAERDTAGVVTLAKELQAHEITRFDRMKPVEDIGEAYVAAIRAGVKEHQGRFLVAESDGTLVGYATLQTMCDSSEDSDEVLYHYAYVGDLVVASSHRGSGIGQMLVAACEHEAKAAELKWLRLSVLAGNDVARKFYAKAGFREHLLLLEKDL